MHYHQIICEWVMRLTYVFGWSHSHNENYKFVSQYGRVTLSTMTRYYIVDAGNTARARALTENDITLVHQFTHSRFAYIAFSSIVFWGATQLNAKCWCLFMYSTHSIWLRLFYSSYACQILVPFEQILNIHFIFMKRLVSSASASVGQLFFFFFFYFFFLYQTTFEEAIAFDL